jgi:L-gulonolactone oxidase
VLKKFGDVPSPGMLSFPMPGLTLALDFRNRGQRTLDLLGRLDGVVAAAGGRHYAAKDTRIPAALFRNAYPALDRFAGFIDPSCTSDFWKKLNA